MAERDISSGAWDAQQNNGFSVHFTLDQTEDGRLSGEARSRPDFPNTGEVFGAVDQAGSLVRGNMVQIVVNWNTGSRGKYVGFFDFDGRLSGNTFDLNHPQSQALWVSNKLF